MKKISKVCKSCWNKADCFVSDKTRVKVKACEIKDKTSKGRR